jgi:glycosyltransferase involved in cell wall biosynthesis
MKILFTVEFYEPQKGGAEEVVRQLAERLFKIGYDVTVATTFVPARDFKILNGVKVEQFRISGNNVRGVKATDSEIARYREFLLGDFNIIINYATQIWTTDLIFNILDKIKAKKVLVSCGYTLKNPKYHTYFNNMPLFLSLYDRVVYMSSNYHDQLLSAKMDLEKKAVIIKNAASEEEFLPQDNFKIKERLGIKTKYLLISISNHYLAKGHDFVIDAFKKMNRNDTTLLIIGEIPSIGLRKILHSMFGCYKKCLLSSLFDKRIKVISGKNRDVILSAYKNADLFLFGSRIECAPLVMYESFASKTPFITTDVGNVKDHVDFLSIIKTPQEMATVANNLLDNELERVGMANKAFKLWNEKHTWNKIIDQYDEMFKSLFTDRV